MCAVFRLSTTNIEIVFCSPPGKWRLDKYPPGALTSSDKLNQK